MNFRRRSERPADRAESDRLLDAARAGSPGAADPEPLARLLSAAAAPARPGELAGEEAALAAFRAARTAAPAAAPQTPRGRRFTAGAVAWAAGIVVTATAGAAFAAVTLDRPDDPAPPPRPTTPTPATTATERGGSTGATGSSGGTPSGAPSDAPLSPSAGPTSGAVTPRGPVGGGPRPPQQRTEQLRGLCRAYLTKPPAQRDKTLDTAAYAGLVTAAGGRENVDDFCRELVPDAAPNKAEPTARATPGPAR